MVSEGFYDLNIDRLGRSFAPGPIATTDDKVFSFHHG
jgi:hypothetical protein